MSCAGDAGAATVLVELPPFVEEGEQDLHGSSFKLEARGEVGVLEEVKEGSNPRGKSSDSGNRRERRDRSQGRVTKVMKIPCKEAVKGGCSNELTTLPQSALSPLLSGGRDESLSSAGVLTVELNSCSAQAERRKELTPSGETDPDRSCSSYGNPFDKSSGNSGIGCSNSSNSRSSTRNSLSLPCTAVDAGWVGSTLPPSSLHASAACALTSMVVRTRSRSGCWGNGGRASFAGSDNGDRDSHSMLSKSPRKNWMHGGQELATAPEPDVADTHGNFQHRGLAGKIALKKLEVLKLNSFVCVPCSSMAQLLGCTNV